MLSEQFANGKSETSVNKWRNRAYSRLDEAHVIISELNNRFSPVMFPDYPSSPEKGGPVKEEAEPLPLIAENFKDISDGLERLCERLNQMLKRCEL